MKGLKNGTALVGTGEASTATPAPAEEVAVHVEEPAQPAVQVVRADPATAPSPTTVSADQPSEETFEEGGAGAVQTAAEASKYESGSMHGEKESAATEEREQEEAAATMKVSTKPKARGELLLDLIRSFRGGMLRVDSNLRAAMFRSLRYLVRIVESRNAQSCLYSLVYVVYLCVSFQLTTDRQRTMISRYAPARMLSSFGNSASASSSPSP